MPFSPFLALDLVLGGGGWLVFCGRASGSQRRGWSGRDCTAALLVKCGPGVFYYGGSQSFHRSGSIWWPSCQLSAGAFVLRPAWKISEAAACLIGSLVLFHSGSSYLDRPLLACRLPNSQSLMAQGPCPATTVC